MNHLLLSCLIAVFGCSFLACSSTATNPQANVVPDPDPTDPSVDAGTDSSTVPDAGKPGKDSGPVDSGQDVSVPDSAPPAWQPCRGTPQDLQFNAYPNNVGPYIPDPKTCSRSPNKLFRYGTCMHVSITYDDLKGHDPYFAEFYETQIFSQICSGCTVVTGLGADLYPVEIAGGFLPWFRANDGTPFWPDGYYTVTLDPTNDTAHCPLLSDPDYVLMISQYSYTRESRMCDRYGGLVQLTHDLVPVLPQQAWAPNDSCPL